jgi:thiol-disulfide isomerase/thioredoxin/Flp pilus assembly protein TadD
VKVSLSRAALAAMVFSLLLGPVARAADPPGAVHVPFLEGKPFAEVLKRAKAEKKPVMLDVVASWCGPCKLMDRTTFADADVVAWAKKVVPARYDAEKGEGRKIAQRYAVRSFPTVIFVDADGNEIDRMLGAFGPPEFKSHGENMVSGKGRLGEALGQLKKSFQYDVAYGLVRSLAERNDLARVRPLAIRIANEDSDFGRAVDSLVVLAALEDMAEKVSPETTDLIGTYVPRLGNDPRRGVLSVVLAREQARRGDAAGAKETVTQAMAAFGDQSQYATDLLVALANAQKNAGQFEASIPTYRKALAAAEAANATRGLQAYVQMNLAEALASAGKREEARKEVASALAKTGEDATALARAAKVSVLLKDTKDALDKARKAVGLSQGEDAESQAALAQALAASGDANGAEAAWRRAGEIDPQNADVKKHQRSAKKSGPAKTS